MHALGSSFAWSDNHGPLKSLGGWASAASLLSPVAQASLDGPDPLYSYYHGTTPKSMIGQDESANTSYLEVQPDSTFASHRTLTSSLLYKIMKPTGSFSKSLPALTHRSEPPGILIEVFPT